MGRSGLLHISEVSHSRIEKVEDVFSEGDTIKVKLIEIDKKTGKYRLSRKALIPKPQHAKSGAKEESQEG
jgi:polyribonucleotide nucleotidyltransferase